MEGRSGNAHRWQYTLRQYVYPRLGAKAVDEVTTADVMAVLLPIWTRKGADTQQVLASIVRTARQRKLDLPELITTMLCAPTPIVLDVLALPPPS